MVFNNIQLIGTNEPVSIRVSGRLIKSVSNQGITPSSDPMQLLFDGALAFPGLINSHDHLDFNLFPQLGNKHYSDYVEWGIYIHSHFKKEIGDILRIPPLLRAKWGMYKNLLAGVTTVVNHGEIESIKEPLISIFRNCYSLHSVRLEKGWKLKLNNPFSSKLPYVIHTGEGIDKEACSEIDELIRWNLLNKELIGIHGVAMKRHQARHFKALVWCPVSNYYLLGKTAPVNELKQETEILFGTDSTLSAGWNIWDHLRIARENEALTDSTLFDIMNCKAASIWNLPGLGKIEENYQADMVIAKTKNGGTGWNHFYDLNPRDLLMVLHQGEIQLYDEEYSGQLHDAGYATNDFYPVDMEGNCKYVRGNLPGLMKEISNYTDLAAFPVSIL